MNTLASFINLFLSLMSMEVDLAGFRVSLLEIMLFLAFGSLIAVLIGGLLE